MLASPRNATAKQTVSGLMWTRSSASYVARTHLSTMVNSKANSMGLKVPQTFLHRHVVCLRRHPLVDESGRIRVTGRARNDPNSTLKDHGSSRVCYALTIWTMRIFFRPKMVKGMRIDGVRRSLKRPQFSVTHLGRKLCVTLTRSPRLA